MTFTIYHKTVQISDKVCDLYKQFVGMPLTDKNMQQMCRIYLEEYNIHTNEVTNIQLEVILTKMMCETICANMGESVKDAKAFLKQKGFL